MSGTKGMKQRRRHDGTLMRRDPFESARQSGRNARSRGDGPEVCPYNDYRTDRGSVTFSRAWRKAWFEGYEE